MDMQIKPVDPLFDTQHVIGSFDIQKIIGEKVLDGIQFYEVRWDCFDCDESPWLSETHLVRDLGRKALMRMVFAYTKNV